MLLIYCIVELPPPLRGYSLYEQRESFYDEMIEGRSRCRRREQGGRREKGGKDLASAGERKANDRNGASESVACLSEASLRREQRNEGRE